MRESRWHFSRLFSKQRVHTCVTLCDANEAILAPMSLMQSADARRQVLLFVAIGDREKSLLSRARKILRL